MPIIKTSRTLARNATNKVSRIWDRKTLLLRSNNCLSRSKIRVSTSRPNPFWTRSLPNRNPKDFWRKLLNRISRLAIRKQETQIILAMTVTPTISSSSIPPRTSFWRRRSTSGVWDWRAPNNFLIWYAPIRANSASSLKWSSWQMHCANFSMTRTPKYSCRPSTTSTKYSGICYHS